MSVVEAESLARHRSEHAAGAPAGRKAFRADIQGLRALAVLLVILYHSRVPLVSAGYVGVDVFFVISGFLITTQLLGEATRTGRISFSAFYARRIRRLLPAALLVAIATVVVSRVALPALQVKDVVTHAVFSSFYAINYRLAAEGVDYQKAEAAASPLQHYWSLAVEEQFYVVWPLIVVAGLWLGRRWGRHGLEAALTLVVAVSLALSVTITASDPSLSYFALHTRAWELGAGALLAIFAGRLAALDRRAAVVAAWVGLAAIVAAAVLYSDDTAFPGTAAALPVGGAALVIAAGTGGALPSITRLVGGRPVQTVGALSYSWYLWHWPVLLLYPPLLHVGHPWPLNLAACAGALGLAWLTHRFVEQRTQRSRLPLRAWWVIGASMTAVTVAAALLVQLTLPPLSGKGPAQDVVTSVGPATPAYLQEVSAAIESSASRDAAPRNLEPDLWSAPDDLPDSTLDDQACLADFLVVDQGPCRFGDRAGSKTVVLFGDSHMEQWQPAFDAAGARGGWTVVDWTKSACPLPRAPVRSSVLEREYTECEAWRTRTLARIVDLQPDLVVVSQSDSNAREGSDNATYAAGTVATVNGLQDAGVPVHYLLDTIYPAADVPSCVSEHLDDVSACANDDAGTSDVSARRSVVASALSTAGIAMSDPAPWQCSASGCPAVVGNMLVYRDSSHFTATYSRWLAPMALAVLESHSARGGG